MNKLFLSAAVLGLLFTACKDDNTNPEPATTPVKLISKVIADNDSILFDYDVNRHITLYQDHQLEEGNILYVKPVYENDKVTALFTGLTTSSLTIKAMTVQYNSKGNVLSVVNYDPEDATPNQFDSVAYDANGRVAALYTAEKTTEAGHLGFYEKQLFEWDAKGNVVKRYEVAIVDGVPTSDTTTTIYTYDDKVNFKAKQAELFLFGIEDVADALSANNILKEVRSAADYTQTTTAMYTYDEDNYPVTVSRTSKLVSGGTEMSTSLENNKLTYIKK